jgi:hypothetical protein
MSLAIKHIDRRPLAGSAGATWLRRAAVFCAAVLLAAALYAVVLHGFDAVVRCELDSYNLLHQDRTAISEIASINGCGF